MEKKWHLEWSDLKDTIRFLISKQEEIVDSNNMELFLSFRINIILNLRNWNP